MPATQHVSSYACSLKGIAMLAIDRWEEAKSQALGHCEEDNMIMTGRCQAYSAVLELITGRKRLEEWKSSVGTMQ